jgi:tetratricopeptide (TPR) repeat protein
VALTDPELDLLREMLVDAPADDVFLQVGEELVRRLRWAEAEQVLTDGLAHLPADDPNRAHGFSLLARASLETGRYDLTASALREVERDPLRNTENARIELLWLERSGQAGAAEERARAFLAADPNDVVAQAVLERMSAPPPSPKARAADPFYTVARAERYVEIGRADRAIRVYRRILLAAHQDPELAARLDQRLRQVAADVSGAVDDLSEDLTDPGLVPELPDPTQDDFVPQLLPKLSVPAPQVSAPSATAAVAIPVAERAPAPEPELPSSELGGADLEDDEPTQTTEESPFSPDDEITDLQVANPARGSSSTAPTVVPESAQAHARERRKGRSPLRR